MIDEFLLECHSAFKKWRWYKDKLMPDYKAVLAKFMEQIPNHKLTSANKMIQKDDCYSQWLLTFVNPHGDAVYATASLPFERCSVGCPQNHERCSFDEDYCDVPDFLENLTITPYDPLGTTREKLNW